MSVMETVFFMFCIALAVAAAVLAVISVFFDGGDDDLRRMICR